MFTWLKTWLSNTARSAYDVTFYRERVKQKYPKPIRHLYGTLWLSSLVTSAVVAVGLIVSIPSIQRLGTTAKTSIPALFPAELVVTIKNGTVKTNVREPYVIEFPREWRTMMDSDKKTVGMRRFEYLVTIDTNAHVEDYERYRSVVLLTKNAVVFPSKANDRVGLDGKHVTTIETTFKTLDDVPDQVINKKFYDDLTGKFLPFMSFIPLIMIIGIAVLITAMPFVFAGLALLWYGFYLFFAAGLLWLATKVLGSPWRYKELYHLSMYGLTLALLYKLVESVFVFHVAWVFSVIFFVWMTYVLRNLGATTTVKKRQRAA